MDCVCCHGVGKMVPELPGVLVSNKSWTKREAGCDATVGEIIY